MFADILRAAILSSLIASVAHAEVRINVVPAVPDGQGKITVDVIIDSDGEEVGGFQNDIVFDHTVVRLDSAADCHINPALGTMPLGGADGVSTCRDDAMLGPCKTLSRNLVACEGDPFPAGCPSEAADYSRLRAILAATEVPNDNSLPDGVAYTCTFTLVNPASLPVRLFNEGMVVSDPFGKRLESGGEDGGVCVEEVGGRRCAPLREIDQRCSIDFECASNNCDRCCGDRFNGICAAPRTPTPSPSATPTKTASSTRTPTSSRSPTPTWTASPTRTATRTPTPKTFGDDCSLSSQCASNLACNQADGGVCCTSINCPQGMACNVPGFAGYCVRGVTPTPALRGAVIEIGSAAPGADGFAEVAISLPSDPYGIGGFQNDILFDNTAVSLDPADCRIASAIGLFPAGPEATSCFDDTSVGACKNLSKTIEECGTDPFPAVCPQSAAPNLSVFRGIVAATAVPNNNAIPLGTLYTCRFRVLDPARLPVVLRNLNVVVSSPLAVRLEATGISGRIEAPSAAPGSTGTACMSATECDSGQCVDSTCCSQASCGAGDSCSISGTRGACAPLRSQGDGCDFGTDCESGNCDLHRSSAASIFRGSCGAPRGSLPPLPAECGDGAECDSGNCLEGFCCETDSCPSGQFCNSGHCAAAAEPGARCTTDQQCALGLCVDGACCVTGSCAAGESCNVPTRQGVCHAPFRLGSPCNLDLQCPTGFCTDGACCLERSCGFRAACNLVPDEGICSPISKPIDNTNGAGLSFIDIGEDIVRADGTAVVTVVLAGSFSVRATQNDILFDNTIVQLDPANCVINPKNSLFPPAAAPASCFDDETIGPCKDLTAAVHVCGAEPQAEGCPDGAGSEFSVFRGVVDATQVANENAIRPRSVLYTCTFNVIDPTRLPTRLVSASALARGFGFIPFVIGFDGSICAGAGKDVTCASVAAADGESCSSDIDCLPGHCERADATPGMGTCVLPVDEPASPPGIPTGGVTPTRTPAPTRAPTQASQPTATATVAGGAVDDPSGDIKDDGCQMSPRGTGRGLLWPLGIAGLIGVVAWCRRGD